MNTGIGAKNGRDTCDGAPIAKRATAFLLNDTFGNVWQWTADWYKLFERDSMETDPKAAPDGEQGVMRGGCWFVDYSYIRA